MSRVAFSIAGAARTANVTEQTIIEAVKCRELTARRVDDKAVILRGDIKRWLRKKPSYKG